MRVPLILFFLFILSVPVSAQTADSLLMDIPYYNFGFEVVNKNEAIPDGWFNFSPASKSNIQSDSLIRHSGKRSVVLGVDADDSKGHAGIAYALPARYVGNELTLKAWLKHEDVLNFVSLFISMTDSTGTEVQAATLDDKQLSGTKDWKLYELRLSIPANVKTIYVGGNIKGPGKLWIDDVQLLIDGTDISQSRLKED
ncbi:hypothetical protein [Pedobacter duraquae]|uniref:Carbohydrate binding protein n=1 Tax=Pedobacter duraquae TaxID=425511 RepID=A0A4R6IL61_9SPHI|nr:hypothetical protein [Pedobacter duraquae]TDO22807.1 hypothetical protein CLV32_1792 [Pedobacter duraquae]